MSGVAEYLTVAGLLSGFGVTVLVFRIQREAQMATRWIAWADFLVIAAILVSLLGVVLPLMAVEKPSANLLRFARSCCSAATVLLAGYPFAILDHYGILPGAHHERHEVQGEPLERVIVLATAVLCVVAFSVTLARVF
jgi:fumarate reductase subunit D